MKKLLTILLFSFCFSPWMISQEQFALEALAPDGNQVNGREYIPLSSDLIKVELAYDCRLGEKFLFDLVVINESGHPISVQPSSFYCLELDDPDGDSSRFPPIMAVPPLQPFKWYDRALEEPQYERMFSPLLELPALFMEGFFASWNGEPSARMLSDKERESHLKDAIRQEMMQEVQLAPGEVANGFVWFQGSPGTNYLLFCFPLDEQEFQFAYEVEKASPY